MNISLDFDGTITADPDFWYKFCVLAKAAGHRVYIVTMRYPEEVVETKTGHVFDALVEDIIYTHRSAKRPYVENLGIDIDIWIDDNPRAVNEHAVQIWPRVFPKGHTTHDRVHVHTSYMTPNEIEDK